MGETKGIHIPGLPLPNKFSVKRDRVKFIVVANFILCANIRLSLVTILTIHRFFNSWSKRQHPDRATWRSLRYHYVRL